RKDIAIAERFEIENSERKVLNGVISPETGAMELGYDKAHDPELIFKKGKDSEIKTPEHKDSRDNNMIEDKITDLEGKIDSVTDNIDKILTSIENPVNYHPFSGGDE
ncbi:MAG TPA: hypothetical protein VMV77_06145, partial [Bacteroidales bacterium]|nr:hypothetical protein [Bacteroidales bacterium]